MFRRIGKMLCKIGISLGAKDWERECKKLENERVKIFWRAEELISAIEKTRLRIENRKRIRKATENFRGAFHE